ncbi:MAG: HNH endonuclease [Candidatus Woesearchaeota archaeon]
MVKQAKLLNYVEPRINYIAGDAFSVSTWRKRVLEKDNNRCQNCFNSIIDWIRGRKFSNEAHHIIPRHHGGTNTVNNGITLCKFCHHYYDLMALRYGYDYFEIIQSMDAGERINQVRQLMKKRFLRFFSDLFTDQRKY